MTDINKRWQVQNLIKFRAIISALDDIRHGRSQVWALPASLGLEIGQEQAEYWVKEYIDTEIKNLPPEFKTNYPNYFEALNHSDNPDYYTAAIFLIDSFIQNLQQLNQQPVNVQYEALNTNGNNSNTIAISLLRYWEEEQKKAKEVKLKAKKYAYPSLEEQLDRAKIIIHRAALQNELLKNIGEREQKIKERIAEKVERTIASQTYATTIQEADKNRVGEIIVQVITAGLVDQELSQLKETAFQTEKPVSQLYAERDQPGLESEKEVVKKIAALSYQAEVSRRVPLTQEKIRQQLTERLKKAGILNEDQVNQTVSALIPSEDSLINSARLRYFGLISNETPIDSLKREYLPLLPEVRSSILPEIKSSVSLTVVAAQNSTPEVSNLQFLDINSRVNRDFDQLLTITRADLSTALARFFPDNIPVRGGTTHNKDFRDAIVNHFLVFHFAPKFLAPNDSNVYNLTPQEYQSLLVKEFVNFVKEHSSRERKILLNFLPDLEEITEEKLSEELDRAGPETTPILHSTTNAYAQAQQNPLGSPQQAGIEVKTAVENNIINASQRQRISFRNAPDITNKVSQLIRLRVMSFSKEKRGRYINYLIDSGRFNTGQCEGILFIGKLMDKIESLPVVGKLLGKGINVIATIRANPILAAGVAVVTQDPSYFLYLVPYTIKLEAFLIKSDWLLRQERKWNKRLLDNIEMGVHKNLNTVLSYLWLEDKAEFTHFILTDPKGWAKIMLNKTARFFFYKRGFVRQGIGGWFKRGVQKRGLGAFAKAVGTNTARRIIKRIRIINAAVKRVINALVNFIVKFLAKTGVSTALKLILSVIFGLLGFSTPIAWIGSLLSIISFFSDIFPWFKDAVNVTLIGAGALIFGAFSLIGGALGTIGGFFAGAAGAITSFFGGLAGAAIAAPVGAIGAGLGGVAAISLLTNLMTHSAFVEYQEKYAPIFYASCYVKDIHKTDVVTEENKNTFVAKYKALFPNSLLEQKIDEVINRSKSAGFNPALAVSIWAEESHFSNYGSAGGETNVIEGHDFGCGVKCPENEPVNFDESLGCFVNSRLSCNNQCLSKTDFKEFMECYGPAAENPDFISNTLVFYRELVPSGSDAMECPGGTTATFASQLINLLIGCYGNIITPQGIASNPEGIDCLSSALTGNPYASTVANYIKASADTNGALQCIGFTKAVEAGTGASNGFTGGAYISAQEYFRATSGYTLVYKNQNSVAVGDLAFFSGDYGHVGVVIKVRGEGGGEEEAACGGNTCQFKIAQAIGVAPDGSPYGLVNESGWLHISWPSLLGFLRRNP